MTVAMKWPVHVYIHAFIIKWLRKEAHRSPLRRKRRQGGGGGVGGQRRWRKGVWEEGIAQLFR